MNTNRLNQKSYIDVNNLINQMITLASSTYEVEEIPNHVFEVDLKKTTNIYKIIAQSASSLVGGPCFVWAYNKEQNKFIYKGKSVVDVGNCKDFYPEELVGIDIQEKISFVNRNTAATNPFISSLKLDNINLIIILPLRSPKQADLVGILICNTPESFKPNLNDSFSLEKLAIQAALTVDHTRLIERLGTLNQITSRIPEEMHSLGLLNTILITALDIPQFSTGQLYLVDKKLKNLYLVVWRGEQPLMNIPFGKHILGEIVLTKEPRYIENLSEVKNSYISQNTGSLYAVPILGEGGILGVLSIQSTIISAFTKLDMYIINEFSQLASVALWGFLKSMESAYLHLVVASEEHILSSSITSIVGNNKHLYRRLLENKIDDKTLKFAKNITDVADRAQKKLSFLYDLFGAGMSIDSSLFNYALHIKSIPIDSVIRELIISREEEAKKAGVNVSLECSEDIQDVNGIHELLILAFYQLFSNSLEELAENNQKDKAINFDIASDNHNIKIKIKDNGRGISDKSREKLFNLHFSTKSKMRGKGLIIAKYIIERHGGQIYLDPASTQGATFVVTLPARKGI